MNSLPIPNMNNPFPNHLRRNSHSSHLLTPEKPTTSQNQIERLRETVFKLNMQIAACRGAKQKLEKAAEGCTSMENYYLTELEARKSRADYLQSQLAMLMEELPSHKPLRIPQLVEGCSGCQGNEETIIRLAQQLNLKNQLLIGLDKSYKDAINRVCEKLKQAKTNAKKSQEQAKDNVLMIKKSTPTQTQVPVITSRPQSKPKPLQERPSFKNMKVVIKRITPHYSANTSVNFDH